MRSVLVGLSLLLALGAAAPASAQVAPDGSMGALTVTGPAVVADGEVGKGEDLVRFPVAFNRTGKLTTPLNASPKTGRIPKLEAGQPMYGLRFMGPPTFSGPKELLVWCTFRPDVTKPIRPGMEFICLPNGMWQDVFRPFPRELKANRGQLYVGPPQVELGPVDFGSPLTASFRLREFDAKDVDIDLMLKIGEETYFVTQYHVRKRTDGSVVLNVLGGQIRLTQVGTDRKRARVEVLSPLTGTAPELSPAE